MTAFYGGMFLVALCLTGAPAGIGISNVGVLYRTEGYTPGTAAALVSCVGLALIAGKILYGELADRLGGKLSSMRWLWRPTYCCVSPPTAANCAPLPPQFPLDWPCP